MVKSIFIWVPSEELFLSITEGSGDNLLEEDIAEGYVDYVNIDTYYYKDLQFNEYDGGQLMLKESFSERYKDDFEGEKLVADSMKLLWNKDVPYVIIEKEEE